MKVFVLGTGRCGTMTFAKACSHITNYTSGHETHAGRIDLNFPNNHIEIDAHLCHYLSILLQKYPTAVYVHLQRNQEDCIKSLSKRRSFVSWANFAFQIKRTLTPAEYKKLAEIHYHNTNDMIPRLIHSENKATYIHVDIEQALQQWLQFWTTLSAKGAFNRAAREFYFRYNSSPKKK